MPGSAFMTNEPAWRPTRQWRRHVYYKVQTRDDVSLVWRDEKPAFDTLELARTYIAWKLPAEATTKIMSVDGRTREPVK